MGEPAEEVVVVVVVAAAAHMPVVVVGKTDTTEEAKNVREAKGDMSWAEGDHCGKWMGVRNGKSASLLLDTLLVVDYDMGETYIQNNLEVQEVGFR